MNLKVLAYHISVALLSCGPANCIRSFERQNDLANSPPVSSSDYTVPLKGGQICSQDGHCNTSSLISPAKGKTLKILALGRGIMTYSCEDELPKGAPTFVSQSTELYDAAALITLLPNEASFHALVTELYEFDYPQLQNSSLKCIGGIDTLDGTPIFTLYELDTFEGHLEESIPPPENPWSNGLWSHSASAKNGWDVYRVEMVGGVVPPACLDKNESIEVGYAAEYWFYQF